jgi:endonuclease/exonuclease/phosphatase family metal-dependent hydrolase
MTKLLLGGMAAFQFVTLAGATVLFSDSFDYPDGSLITVSAGTWAHHSPAGSATGEVMVAAGRLRLAATNREDVQALLSGQPYGAAGTTNVFYAGFRVRFSSLPGPGGAYFAHFKDSSATGFRARVWALTGGAAPGKFRLGISSASSSAISATNPVDLSLDTDYLVVTRLVNSNSLGTLWINPAAESDPGISTAEGASTFTVVAFAFRESSGEGTSSIDELRVGTSFVDVATNAPPLEWPRITLPPRHQAAGEGAEAIFAAGAAGSPPLHYQWQFNGTNLPGATLPALTLSNVSFAQAGVYAVVISNLVGCIQSDPVTLNVWSAAAPVFSLLTYNAHGNGVENWSANSYHVRAIGRQMQCLQPDIITFQEIPDTNTYQMPAFVNAFLPGYYLATNSASDGYIRSVIVSRFPILSSTSRLFNSDLAPYGYTNSGFTRDLFEARVCVPDFPQPLHVFTVHLKSGQDRDSSAKRAAEAGAISNFIVSTYLAINPLEPCVLTGDMNEDLFRPPATDPQSLQRLTGAATGLQLSTPFNPFTGSELTYSIRNADGLTRRYDYILPCGLLFSNVTGSQVFRTDLLPDPPPPLRTNDDQIASDHLPVLMVFGNPYNKPFRVTALSRRQPSVMLSWESVSGQSYCLESSSNLVEWTVLAANLTATGSVFHLTATVPDAACFFRVRRTPPCASSSQHFAQESGPGSL